MAASNSAHRRVNSNSIRKRLRRWVCRQCQIGNPTREKKLTNIRSSTGEELVRLIPHRQLSLEQALEFCREDECVEVTPAAVRLRKVVLSAQDRAKLRARR